MTKDEALRLALEALKDRSSLMKWQEAITAIKAALEAKDEPVANAITEQAYESGYSTGFMDGAIKAREAKDGCQCPACKVAPHASDCAVHSEPAYPAGKCNCGVKGEPERCTPNCEALLQKMVTQRKPLTDEEIERIYNRYGGEMINCARAIERAHGIKGQA